MTEHRHQWEDEPGFIPGTKQRCVAPGCPKPSRYPGVEKMAKEKGKDG